jgi:hypothetical protein
MPDQDPRRTPEDTRPAGLDSRSDGHAADPGFSATRRGGGGR